MTLEEQIRKFCHDVATPLSVVQGFLKVSDGQHLTSPAKELLDAARISMEKIKALLEELHRLAESGGS